MLKPHFQQMKVVYSYCSRVLITLFNNCFQNLTLKYKADLLFPVNQNTVTGRHISQMQLTYAFGVHSHFRQSKHLENQPPTYFQFLLETNSPILWGCVAGRTRIPQTYPSYLSSAGPSSPMCRAKPYLPPGKGLKEQRSSPGETFRTALPPRSIFGMPTSAGG